MTEKQVNQLEDELSPEIITLLQSDNDGIHFMFKPNTLVGGMERDGIHFVFGEDLTLPCGISQLAEWLLFQRSLLESNSWEGRNAMLNWLNGIMHSKPLAGAIKKAEIAKKEAGQRENQFLVEEPLSEEEDAAQQVDAILWLISTPDEWLHWAGKPTLVAEEAIPLMNGLDPKSWCNRENRRSERENPLPDDMVIAITRGLKIAEADGSIAKSPTEWLAWGRRHGLDKPTMKSGNELREFDICMWPLFAQAVAEVGRKGEIEPATPVVVIGNSELCIMKKAALIAKLEAEGFLETDKAFRHSDVNGLREAAKADKHGYWFVNKTLAWFEQKYSRTKQSKVEQIPPSAGIEQLRARTHIIK